MWEMRSRCWRVFSIGIITASDKGSRGEREDISGKTIASMLQELGEVKHYVVVPDEQKKLSAEIIHMVDQLKVDLVLTTGGTGLGPRDVTPEATLAVIDRTVPGIPEAMRAKSLEITNRAMLSRAVAGMRGRALIINLPGSPKGVKECLEVVLPVLEHGLSIMKGEAGECARTT
jgi:molybdopterin adenylyltransferase